MILHTDPKPIRVSLRSGTNDLDNQFGSWLDANFAMADALEAQGYHYRFTHGTGGHDMAQAAKDMAEEWRRSAETIHRKVDTFCSNYATSFLAKFSTAFQSVYS